MQQSGFLAVVVLLSTFGAVGCSPPQPAASTRPNVVFVLTDDQRWDAISLQGNSAPLETPHIDRLGREGVYFRNAFATTSLCSPSRASILTG
jgi:arylsulfatase A-like enzyme